MMKEVPIALKCKEIDIDANLMRILGVKLDIVSILNHRLKNLTVNYCPYCLSEKATLNGVRESKRLKEPYARQQKFKCMNCGKSFSSITYDEKCVAEANDLRYDYRLLIPKGKLTYDQWYKFVQLVLMTRYQKTHGVKKVNNTAEWLEEELRTSVMTIYNCKKTLLDALNVFRYTFTTNKNDITFDSECWIEIANYYNTVNDEKEKDYFVKSILWILILALKNKDGFNELKKMI